VLPVGSFEQHGDYLPLITDTVVASVIARELARVYPVLQLPPVTISCSHEHSAWAGTASISASTLYAIVNDVYASVANSGLTSLVVLNGHEGNYVLGNVVQEGNAQGKRMALFPSGEDWAEARESAGLSSSGHEDMHAGEIETSILLHAHPELVRDGYEAADWVANDRRHLLTTGMGEYTLGRPRGWAAARAGRPAMRSLGRPPVARREHRQRFWVAIARGIPSEDADIEAGVSPAVGTRWFRESGGIRPVSLAPLSGRYLSFAEREEIAVLRVRGCGVREATSRTEARWSLPSPAGISVPSPYHFWLVSCAGKSRRTRSGARQRPLPGRVVALRFFFRRAARPSPAITAATVFSLTAQPSSRRSAVIRGDPYLPPCAPNSRLTSALSCSRRGGSTASSCL
jgi:creatinine amidohydrolase